MLIINRCMNMDYFSISVIEYSFFGRNMVNFSLMISFFVKLITYW